MTAWVVYSLTEIGRFIVRMGDLFSHNADFFMSAKIGPNQMEQVNLKYEDLSHLYDAFWS